ncbi:MAG TPA: hypothetical protein VF595_02640 [Tepidisphaeraceae bacterium]
MVGAAMPGAATQPMHTTAISDAIVKVGPFEVFMPSLDAHRFALVAELFFDRHFYFHKIAILYSDGGAAKMSSWPVAGNLPSKKVVNATNDFPAVNTDF